MARRTHQLAIVSAFSILALVALFQCTPSLPTQRLTATRFEVIPIGPTELSALLPESVRYFLMNPKEPAEREVADLDAAVQAAGFSPRLPQALSPAPRFSVIAPINKEARIRTEELRTLLKQSGIHDIDVPDDWNGIEVGMEMSAGIGARYGDIYLAQRLPLAIDAPKPFPLDALLECLLRITRIGPADARDRRQRFAANPADFLLISPKHQIQAHEVSLQSGAGIHLEGSQRMLVWSARDRSYFLSGSMSEAEAVAIANSVR